MGSCLARAFVLLALSLWIPGCGGGGGGSGSGGDDEQQPSGFQLEAVSFARALVGPDGQLEALLNPASLHEVDPLTGVPLAGFPKPLNAGADLGQLAELNLAQVQDPFTPQVPLVPRNAALVLEFTKPVDGATLGLVDGAVTSASTVQVQRQDGSVVPARAWALDDRVVLLGVAGGNLGWEPSPLVFDAQGKVVEDPTGHLRVLHGHGVGLGTLAAVDGEAVGPRPDGLGSLAKPFPLNPGNSQLDAIAQQTDAGVVGFNGFLPDTSPPRLVRPVTASGTISAISSVSVGGLAAARLTDADLQPAPGLLANDGDGEWAQALLTVTSAGGFTTEYVVDANLELAGEPVFQLLPGQVLHPAVTVGDDYTVQRTEFFEPVPPPLPSDPQALARVTVDPENVPRDPHDPQDAHNSDLRWFTRVFDEHGTERTDVWDPRTGVFTAIPPRSSLQLQFSEPMDLDSFRPYETFMVSDGALDRTDPAFLDMRIGAVQGLDDGRAVRFVPFLEDQLDPAAGAWVGFGGSASALRLVLRTCPEQADIDALKDSATTDVLEQLTELDTAGVTGITDLGGRGLGLPLALLDPSDVEHFLLADGSAGRGAFPPAVDFVLGFETSPSEDPDHGVLVHRFMGQPSTAVFDYPEGSVHDQVTAGVEYHDYPPEDVDADGVVDRRYLYGPQIVEVGLNVPGRLSGAPANTIEHLIDDFNPPKPSNFASPNGEDLLISLGFGLQTPINSPFGARFQHIYRAGDASPSVNDYRGVTLDLVGLAWSPLLNPDGKIQPTQLDGLEILVGLSGINRGRGPNTNQTNGIPKGAESGLKAQFDCNLLEWADNCDINALGLMDSLAPYAAQQPKQTAVVARGTPYLIQQSALFKPASAGGSAQYNPYLDYPPFNGGVDPFFGRDDVKSFPYDSRFAMLIEYRLLPNEAPPARNIYRFSPGILTSALPRFRVWSQGQHPLAYGVPNTTIAAATGTALAGEGGPRIEPGTLLTAIKPPVPNNGMPPVGPAPDGPPWTYILPPHDPPGTPLQTVPDRQGGGTPVPNSDPDMNWYFADGMLAHPLPNVVAYPGPPGQPPTAWVGYGTTHPIVGALEPSYQPGPGRFGDNSRYYLMWKYRKRVSIVESPTLRADTPAGLVRHLRPIIEPPLDVARGVHELRLEVRAGPYLDYAIGPADSGWVEVDAADYVQLVNGASLDRPFIKFKATFGVASGHVQGPVLDTIVLPYEKPKP